MGKSVLLHCRQGKHRSGLMTMLIMGILCSPSEYPEGYWSLCVAYFERNPRLNWRFRGCTVLASQKTAGYCRYLPF